MQSLATSRRERVLLLAEASAKTLLDIWDWGDDAAKEIILEYLNDVWRHYKDDLKNSEYFKELVRRGALPP